MIKRFFIFSIVIVLACSSGVLSTWAQSGETKLTASDGAASDLFGQFVSISGDTIVVGAHRDADNGPGSGSAYVFVREGTSWVERQKLTASDGTDADFFGHSGAVNGDTIVIGAHGDGDSGIDSGSAYVFVRDGTSWVEQQKLTASDGAAWDQFGNSVSIYGDTIVVGAHRDADNGIGSGSVYVFVREGTSWVEQQKLTASDGAAWDQFGNSVSVNGDIVIISAPYDDDNGLDSGSAYVFVCEGATWIEQHKLTAGDGAALDSFGYSVSVNGDTVIISAPYDDDNGSNSGSTYVFAHDDTGWVEQQKLTASDGAKADFFGYSVSIGRDVVIIGAAYDDNNGPNLGSAYVFVHGDTDWIEQQKLTASDGVAWDRFGRSVSISEGMVVVGAAHDDDNGISSGSAYVYSVNLDPAILIDNFDSNVHDLNLSQGTANNLHSKLDAALKAITDLNETNDQVAVNTMSAFISQIEAQRGKKITDEIADTLIAQAQSIIALLSSQ